MHSPPADGQNILQNLTLNVLGNQQCEKYIELNSSEACESIVYGIDLARIFVFR